MTIWVSDSQKKKKVKILKNQDFKDELRRNTENILTKMKKKK